MSSNPVPCPKCESPHSYQDAGLWICPECFHEWTEAATPAAETPAKADTPQFLDANGTKLETGDTVITIRDLSLGNDTLKSGTKVKNIRLLEEPVDGHDIACKLPEHGSIYLKCAVVKKAK